MSALWHPFANMAAVGASGTLTIEPFSAKPVGTEETASTSPLTLEVTSLLTDAEGGIEAPAPPFPLPFPWQRWGLTAAAVLTAARHLFRRDRDTRHAAIAALKGRGNRDIVPALIQANRFVADDKEILNGALRALTGAGEDHLN